MESPKYVLIVLDGLGDLPVPSLGDKTPLEAAKTPHMDRLAGLGALGTLNPVRRGVAPESDAGVLSLLGYDAETESPGRGVLEAMGIGVRLGPGEVALRLNFATADDTGLIIDQRVGRGLTTQESSSLATALTEASLVGHEGIEARFQATIGHRGILQLKPRDAPALSADVSNSDPYYERAGRAGHAVKPERPYPKEITFLADNAGARRTAEALNLITARSVSVLENHPVNKARKESGALLANRILMRDAGAKPTGIPPFQERHGLHGAAVTEMPVERGIAEMLGLEDISVGPMGTDVAGDLGYRAEVVRAAISRVPFVYAHLKGPDEPGHDGKADRKRDVIESLDRHFIGPFLDGLDLSRVCVAITADHSTPCVRKGHSDDPVPLVIAGGASFSQPAHAPLKFSEPNSSRGTLGEMSGKDLIPLMLGRKAPAGR